MEWHPLVEQIVSAVVVGFFLVALLAFYAGLGAWMNHAYENGRWIWFALLLLFMFPVSLIAWLVMRAMNNRRQRADLASAAGGLDGASGSA